MNEQTDQTAQTQAESPKRSGACPFCLRKHLLKAVGYAEEVVEDSGRDWERDRLLMNLLLAEDHADALGASDLRSAIRTARLGVEDGVALEAVRTVYDTFLASPVWLGAKTNKQGEF